MQNGNGKRILRQLPKGIKVMVAMPTGGMWVPNFGMDLADMMAWTTAVFMQMPKGSPDFILRKREGTYTEDARNMLARDALKLDCTHILWLDTDMRFPRDTMYRLLLHQKPIVGANYSTRMPPFYPTALALEKNPDGSERLWPEDNATGLSKAHAIGHGVLMVETEVYRRLKNTPWYQNFWVNETSLVGEDVFFCRGALDVGLDIWIDHDLSWEVSHCGAWEFNLRFARQYRELELAAGHEHPEAEAQRFRREDMSARLVSTDDANAKSTILDAPLIVES